MKEVLGIIMMGSFIYAWVLNYVSYTHESMICHCTHMPVTQTRRYLVVFRPQGVNGLHCLTLLDFQFPLRFLIAMTATFFIVVMVCNYILSISHAVMFLMILYIYNAVKLCSSHLSDKVIYYSWRLPHWVVELLQWN